VPTPVHASDFTGVFTFAASIFGIVFLLVAGSGFGFSFIAPPGKVRLVLRIAGSVLGAVLTVWWINIPVAEGYAILILLSWILGSLTFVLEVKRGAKQ
jgi:hypothetical protein